MIHAAKCLVLILAVLLLLLCLSLPIWVGIFHQDGQYVWWNLRELNKIADTIMKQDSIESLHRGNDYCGEFGRKEPYRCFDSYRFLNGDEITHHPEQAHSGTVHIKTYLAEHNISQELYNDLSSQMKALDIKGFDKDTSKQTISFMRPGHYDVGACIAYSPNAFFSYPADVRWVAPNWYVAIIH